MSSPSKNQAPYAEVLTLLEEYYDGLYHLDATKLRRVFSSSAHYATIANGSLLHLSMDEYFSRLEQRSRPADEGAPYASKIVSIRFAGEHTALAEVQCSLFGHDYTDFLSLLRIDGHWRIQSKVFEGIPQPPTEAH